MIDADPDTRYGTPPQRLGAEHAAGYPWAIHDPATILAACEDCRGGLGLDRTHDAAR